MGKGILKELVEKELANLDFSIQYHEEKLVEAKDRRWWRAVTMENYIHVVTYVTLEDVHYSTCFYELDDALEYAERLEEKTGRVVHITNAEVL